MGLITKHFVTIAGAIVAACLLLLWILWHPLIWYLTPDAARLVADGVAKVRCGVFLDRHGKVLRYFPNSRGDFQVWVPLASCPIHLVQAVIAAEDRNFWQHAGFDVTAIVRAIWQNITKRRIVSGASSITQQLIRLVRPRPRTFTTKLTELLLASKLEMQIDKKQILENWLNLAPMFGNLRGVGIAAQVLFQKDIERINLAEAATLAAFPQSPSRLNPESLSGRRLLLARRNWILNRMKQLKMISANDEYKARTSAMPVLYWQKGQLSEKSDISSASNSSYKSKHEIRRLPFRAPHFVDWLVSNNGPPVGQVVTSLDLDIQDRLYEAIKAHRDRLVRCGARQAAGLVIDTKTMEILAMVGSFEYGSKDGGYNNGCLAPRSGGSILKPFLYAMALEQGYHAGSIIPDTRRSFRTPQGDYLPYNATRRDYGPVSIRTALGNSLNISAVKMLNELGVKNFYQYLNRFGLVPTSETLWKHYGLGLAIGNPEVRMIDIAAAFGSLAHAGRKVQLRTTPGPVLLESPLMSETTAWILLDIMSDPSARLLTFGNPSFFAFDQRVALKTGTSTNYRDCWLFAITPAYLIGLWVGNFDGAPTNGLGGATACGPILYQLLKDLPAPNCGWFSRPASVTSVQVCGTSGQSPTPFCPTVSQEWIDKASLPIPTCTFHMNQGTFHELPTEYAAWIQRRSRSLRIDPFRLQGGLTVGDPFTFTEANAAHFSHEEDNEHFRCFETKLGSENSSEIMCDSSHDHTSEDGTISSFAAPICLQNSASDCASHTSRSGEVIRVGRSLCEYGAVYGGLRIISPHDGDRFVMVPGGENLIRLQAVPDVPIPEVIWLIDGAELARTPPPYEVWWPLQRGRHTITALSLGEEAAQISINVE